MSDIVVTGLNIYPVKSLRGISLQEAVLTTQGLQHDRRWMVVRESGKFVTQRDISTLALIETHLEEDGVVLSRDGFGSKQLLFSHRAGAAISSKVWKDEVETTDEGDEVAAWLTAATQSKHPLRMVRMAAGFTRQHSAAGRFGAENATVFADASPYLLANQQSLEALNVELQARGHAAVPMNRFRANIVVSGMAAFSEHQTGSLGNEHYAFGLRDACERCVVPTIDQETAERNPQHEPFKTLTDINPMPNAKAPAFAENSILLHGAGQLVRVGDKLQVQA
ncbi:MAG TPA: MOSC N-terminal beta barrel domain-containing protein [Xanthomonadales bacterium]|nr:MOSC N-terminal beta barrel domain-containing protein [Xanthomonadales bacterium]